LLEADGKGPGHPLYRTEVDGINLSGISIGGNLTLSALNANTVELNNATIHGNLVAELKWDRHPFATEEEVASKVPLVATALGVLNLSSSTVDGQVLLLGADVGNLQAAGARFTSGVLIAGGYLIPQNAEKIRNGSASHETQTTWAPHPTDPRVLVRPSDGGEQ